MRCDLKEYVHEIHMIMFSLCTPFEKKFDNINSPYSIYSMWFSCVLYLVDCQPPPRKLFVRYCILPLYTTLYDCTRILQTHFYADFCKVRGYNNPIDQDETCYSGAHRMTHVAQQTSKIYRNDCILRSLSRFGKEALT